MSHERVTGGGQTPPAIMRNVGTMCVFVVSAVVASAVLGGGVASADDSGFHRTTPRASFDGGGPALVIGVPGGRAWGIESELRPLPPAGTSLYVRLTVSDDAVREAFVRVAYCATADKRTRQLATSDSAPVSLGR